MSYWRTANLYSGFWSALTKMSGMFHLVRGMITIYCATRVTLLVVEKGYRCRHIATYFVQMLQRHPLFEGVTTVGIASHHPAACQAVAKLKGEFNWLLRSEYEVTGCRDLHVFGQH